MTASKAMHEEAKQDELAFWISSAERASSCLETSGYDTEVKLCMHKNSTVNMEGSQCCNFVL
eukprot:scaffold111861_cov16-Tisochrysis_lutea.AAC.1